MAFKALVIVLFLLQIWENAAEIRRSSMNSVAEPNPARAVPPIVHKHVPVNVLKQIKPVGAQMSKNFVPLTEIPPPRRPPVHFHNGRRHMENDCTEKVVREVVEGGNVELWGDYYEEKFAKTVATVIFPDHIDHKHFEVTTQVPYLTVGNIDAIGYHPSTIKSEHPSECEKIYQDHIADQYSDETTDYSEESLEMARMPLFPPAEPNDRGLLDTDLEANMYADVSF